MTFESGEQKQRLNLSRPAYTVVQNDQCTFRADSRSGFLNRIFKHYAPKADTSIHRRLMELQGTLEESLSEITRDEKTKSIIIAKLIKQKESTLKARANSYKKGESFLFTLNKENFDYLSGAMPGCEEYKYYKRRGEYIKCVVEEYAQLPYIQRERVYFGPFIKEIEDAIQAGCQLYVGTDRNKTYDVYPYQILPDPLSMANYLVGFCRQHQYAEEEKHPVTFRISALQFVKMEKSKSAFLKKTEQKKLVQTIESRGVQFMSSAEEDILVKLSEQGKYKYHRHAHLRPALVKQSGEDIFEFRCTPAQAEFYFFKFGKDAEIIQPERLREKMADMYKCAAEMYRRNDG